MGDIVNFEGGSGLTIVLGLKQSEGNQNKKPILIKCLCCFYCDPRKE